MTFDLTGLVNSKLDWFEKELLMGAVMQGCLVCHADLVGVGAHARGMPPVERPGTAVRWGGPGDILLAEPHGAAAGCQRFLGPGLLP